MFNLIKKKKKKGKKRIKYPLRIKSDLCRRSNQIKFPHWFITWLPADWWPWPWIHYDRPRNGPVVKPHSNRYSCKRPLSSRPTIWTRFSRSSPPCKCSRIGPTSLECGEGSCATACATAKLELRRGLARSRAFESCPGARVCRAARGFLAPSVGQLETRMRWRLLQGVAISWWGWDPVSAPRSLLPPFSRGGTDSSWFAERETRGGEILSMRMEIVLFVIQLFLRKEVI